MSSSFVRANVNLNLIALKSVPRFDPNVNVAIPDVVPLAYPCLVLRVVLVMVLISTPSEFKKEVYISQVGLDCTDM